MNYTIGGTKPHKLIIGSAFNSIAIEFVFFVIIYRIFIDWAYKEVIATLFHYLDFSNNSTHIWKIISWSILIIFLFIIQSSYKNASDKISYEVLYVLFLMSFVPFTSLVGFGECTAEFIISNIIYWLAFIFVIQHDFIFNGIKSIRITTGPSKLSGDSLLLFLTIISALVVLYVSGRYTHFRFNFSLLNVYDLREEAKGYQMPTFLVYLFSWSRMINSILLAYFVQRKKYYIGAFLVFIQLLNFGVDGSKTTLFLMIFAIIINIIPQIELSIINKWITVALMLTSGVSMVIYKLTGQIMAVSLLVRRLLFVPAQIQTYYFDFFTTHTPDFFRQSVLRIFGIKSPYPSIAHMIGELYSHQITSDNNGLISDGLANFGIFGIIIMPLFLGLILKIMDVVSEGLDVHIYIIVALYCSQVLINSFLFTVLMTHGLLVTMILLNWMKRNIHKAYPLDEE